MHKWVKNLKNIFNPGNKSNYLGFKSSKELLKALEDFFGFKISQKKFYIKALTHRSAVDFELTFHKSNERLEFLGDSVLGFVVADILFHKYQNEDEGHLTKLRAFLVNKAALTKAARKMQLSRFIIYDTRFINESEDGFGKIQADCVEALIGAIYLDKGLSTVKKFISKWLVEPNLNSNKLDYDQNYKGHFLEYTHSHKLGQPIYKVVNEEGLPHNKFFTVQVFVDDKLFGTGKGKNKKSAEQEASKNALNSL